MSNVATQFKKGQSGNPKGGPKKEWTMKSLIIEALEESGKDKIPVKKKIAQRLATMAENGDIVAIKEVNNRIDGMAQQDITSAGKPLGAPIYGGKSTDSTSDS